MVEPPAKQRRLEAEEASNVIIQFESEDGACAGKSCVRQCCSQHVWAHTIFFLAGVLLALSVLLRPHMLHTTIITTCSLAHPALSRQRLFRPAAGRADERDAGAAGDAAQRLAAERGQAALLVPRRGPGACGVMRCVCCACARRMRCSAETAVARSPAAAATDAVCTTNTKHRRLCKTHNKTHTRLYKQELGGELGKHLAATGLSVEKALRVVYTPQAVFRVRPVARCTASMPGGCVRVRVCVCALCV